MTLESPEMAEVCNSSNLKKRHADNHVQLPVQLPSIGIQACTHKFTSIQMLELGEPLEISLQCTTVIGTVADHERVNESEDVQPTS